MFYSQFILAKKGPLGTIWIAAHLERKLRKNQVADTDIGISVDSILFPEMPIALRLSSHLLLGVVRIYSRKVNYLFDDCSEALLKVKQAFRSTAVDLPPEESTAPYHSITLPETFDLDDFELPGSEMYQGNYVDHHISSKEQITLQDTMEGVVYSTSNFGLDERFGDGDACALDLEEELLVEKAATSEHASGTSNSEYPQAAFQVNPLIKYDHNQDNPIIPEEMPAGNIVNQHVEEYDGDDGPVEYAHAPCTPGLWEEPNLSNIQETSAYDDHQEPENHTITQVSVKENLEHASGVQHHNQFEPIEKLPPHIVITEQMTMNDLGSTPFADSHIVDQVRSMSPIAEVSETVVSVVDDPVKVIDSLNKNTTHQEPEIHTVDNNHENHVQHQGMSNNIAHHVVNQENAFHPTNELELNTEPSCDQAFMQPKDSTIPVQSTNSFDFMGLRPCVTLSNHDASSLPPPEITSLPLPSLESSSSAYGAPIMMQGEIPHTTEQLERNLQETYNAEVGPNNVVQVASSIPNTQVENVIERDIQVHNFHAPEKVLSFPQGHLEAPKDLLPESSTPIHQSAYTSSISNRQVDIVNEREVQVHNSNSYTSNFPAPENLLSFSQDVPKNLAPETTPIIAPGYEGDAATTNRYSGRKRSITESSMTAQSLNFNLNESSTFFTTNNSRESFQDDDLLSSILVGRNSSILKMKPTPTTTYTEVPSTKRRRQSAPKTTPKTGVLKRKVLMDDNMVLHGDTIRQQLTNTEDIRRLRKKAPCTHSEVSLIEKQFWEDELFGKAILTGMSNKLTSLQRQLYDISKNVISQYDASLEVGKTDQKSISNNDEKEIQPQSVSIGPDVLKENKEQDNFDHVPTKDVSEAQVVDVLEENKDLDNFDHAPTKDVSEEQVVDVLEENKDQDKFDHVVMKDVSESQPIDNHIIHDNNSTNFDYYENHEHMHTTGDFTELFGPEHDILEHATAMEIDVNSFQDADVGAPVMPIEAESLTHADVDANAAFDTSAAMTQVDVVQRETFEHDNDTSAAVNEVDKTSQRVVTLLTGPPPGFDININKSIESNVNSERKLGDDGDASERETPEERQEASTTFCSETDGLKNDLLNLEQDTEIRNNEEEIVNKDAECNPQDLVSNGVLGEEFVPYDSAQVNPELGDVLLDEREKPPRHQVATIPVTTLNLEDIPTDNMVDVNDHDYTYSGVANDTDFLNFDDVDDDEAGEAADDYMPDGEETKILDNSGWSSRTRAVAKYLQIMFDKEGERGRNMLGVNNLLAGKTRKEASRMFFETLVLKSKDYIHVEQADPFENINVFPRAKLLKSEF